MKTLIRQTILLPLASVPKSARELGSVLLEVYAGTRLPLRPSRFWSSLLAGTDSAQSPQV